MHIYNLHKWKSRHRHEFEMDHEFGEARSRIVLVLTATTMVIEIVAGTLFGSMALLADGWHMGTHAAAFGITLFAYWYAKKHKDSVDFTFSTGKVSVLGGFASAVALAVVALVMALESVGRFFDPHEIRFDEAMWVAAFGFAVNGVSVFLLHHHEHTGEHTHDHNLRSAYFHVLADTLTSVLAVVALSFGKFLGWVWLDPFMGIVGAVIISHWAFSLVRSSSDILLDRSVDEETKEKIIRAIENNRDNRVVDLHAWHVSPKHMTLVVSIVTHYPQDPEHYKTLLSDIAECSHITVEVNHCGGRPCIPKEGTTD